MNRHIVIHLLLLAAVAGTAHAEVYKCMDQGGNVTLTDVPCPAAPEADAAAAVAAPEAEQEQVLAAAPAPAAPARGITRISLVAGEMPALARQRQAVARRTAGQPFALDAATLKAAHYTLSVRDSAATQQKLAALR